MDSSEDVSAAQAGEEAGGGVMQDKPLVTYTAASTNLETVVCPEMNETEKKNDDSLRTPQHCAKPSSLGADDDIFSEPELLSVSPLASSPFNDYVILGEDCGMAEHKVDDDFILVDPRQA